MHLTKPALVAASFLWATVFASPINSPAILRTRGLIGGSTTDGNTKDIAGSTAAGNTVGSDNTKSVSKSNAVEGAIESFHLDDFTGGLTARDVSKSGHRHKSHEDDTTKDTAGDVVDAVGGAFDTTRNDSISDDANDASDAKSDSGIIGGLLRRGIVGDDAESLTARDISRHRLSHKRQEDNIANSVADDVNDATEGAGMGDDANDTANGADGADGAGADGAERRFVARDNDGTVHDANKAVHDANKAAIHDANEAVHDANKVVHNTVHGLLSGILR
ncbi:hypothetical protein BOTCAL_0213g00110 [Botryotinia calthae]|uniref:Uncharacterized protein n=1 Tax=Botryotinia calthae TaxID=38488 RepID=A0A4Y8CYL6_9HELO|nr:hypothetical protein BOTCAL_0213g00110 [Botryotinia calthae]